MHTKVKALFFSVDLVDADRACANLFHGQTIDSSKCRIVYKFQDIIFIAAVSNRDRLHLRQKKQ